MHYVEAIEQAILYMEEHLHEELFVHDVADAVGYSYYHFTRIFQSVVGESMGSYIQKRRLAKAAQMLVYSNNKVLNIAMVCGFQSAEAFSRAFKSVYQVSPALYRKHRFHTLLGDKKALDYDMLQHIREHMDIQPQIIQTKASFVVGIHGICDVANLYSLWQRFAQCKDDIPNQHPRGRCFGICEYTQAIHSTTYDMPFSEVIGVEVTSFEKVPTNLVKKIIPAGKYAVFIHKGPIHSIDKTYAYIWGTWALLTNEVLSERDDFELYDERFLAPDHALSQIAIYIPIE